MTNKDRTSGIYEIKNLLNNKRYIGQSQNIYIRVTKHINLLKRNCHSNKHLQSAWNKYGEESFECNALEHCEKEQLNEKEEYWIDYYNSNNNECGYNIRINAFDNRGLKWSDEQRAKMQQYFDNENGYWKNHTIPREVAEKGWEASRNKVWTEEERLRHSKALLGTKVKDTRNMKIAQTGETNNGAKLKQYEVEEIIYLLHCDYSQIFLSKIYNVSYSTICAINRKRSWAFLDRDAIIEDNIIKNRANERISGYEYQ